MKATTLDGLATLDSFSFLADSYPGINQWSTGTTVKVTVVDFYMNPRNVTWKGKTLRVPDYEWFIQMIKQWCEDKYFPQTKEQALDLFFSMA